MIALPLTSSHLYALVNPTCSTESGSPFGYSYNWDLNSSNNIEEESGWQEQNNGGSYFISGDCSPLKTTLWHGVPGPGMSVYQEEISDTWYKFTGNNYIVLKMKIYITQRNSDSRYYSVPFRDATEYCLGANVCTADTPTQSGSRVQVNFKIIKPFIGSFLISQQIASLYASQGFYSQDYEANKPIAKIFLNAKFSVPQSCSLNTGDIISFDYDRISTQAFAETPIGQKPEKIPVQVKTLDINCKNIEAEKLLSIRVVSNQTDGNYIISSNKDVGFALSDGQDRILYPNNSQSFIKFKLASGLDPSAKITLKAWPVSLTGRKPEANRPKGYAYLRVDFL